MAQRPPRSIRFPPDLDADIAKLALQRGMTEHAWIVKAVSRVVAGEKQRLAEIAESGFAVETRFKKGK